MRIKPRYYYFTVFSLFFIVGVNNPFPLAITELLRPKSFGDKETDKFIGELQNALKCNFDVSFKTEKTDLEDKNENQRYLIGEFKKELESKKNCKFQEKCILITQIPLNKEPIQGARCYKNSRILSEKKIHMSRQQHCGDNGGLEAWYEGNSAENVWRGNDGNDGVVQMMGMMELCK
ncbi:hypothetical protein Glove_186g11 [Diversispora epigaea]|uniref:Uncharacterized protein n=1 Tax=Diversispora epigaea TaxID=1348612 RepID=A0A397IS04_9GLOM|nr:hypothetical protein Glove_186g11 [Diversispora epigaea]